MARPTILVVSLLADAPTTPRGARTQALLEGLRDWADVALLAREGAPNVTSKPKPWHVRQLGRAARTVLLDVEEVTSRRLLQRQLPSASGAVLIGYPFSTIALAARQLVQRDVQYVVDVGDPWRLTSLQLSRSVAALRGRRAETFLWRHARGGIVTTEHQRAPLAAMFPELNWLVRPNGTHAQRVTPARHRRSGGRVLRIAHFGTLYESRLPVMTLLSRIASDHWDTVEVHQYGADWTGVLHDGEGVSVVMHDPLPWKEVQRIVTDYDVVAVIGNVDPGQLPSKAISYLSLQAPRLAITGSGADDALASYVKDKPGWLTVSPGDEDVSDRLAAHLSRAWSVEELSCPDGETWPAVASELSEFVRGALFHGKMLGGATEAWPRP